MSGRVLQFTPRFCAACKGGLHSRCWAWLDEVFGAQGRPCPCDCRDERGDLTRHALIDMATRTWTQHLTEVLRSRHRATLIISQRSPRRSG